MNSSLDQQPSRAKAGPVPRALALARVDFSPVRQPPRMVAVVAATVVALAGSLAADAALVALGTAIFPSTSGYVHFAFGDYAKLTVIGVLVACAAWPVVTRITSAPRWLFLRLALAVTLVLFLPDLWILLHGAPLDAVGVLMAMHMAIAIVTYNSLVHLAPPGRRRLPPASACAGPAGRRHATGAGAGRRPSPGPVSDRRVGARRPRRAAGCPCG